jgi:hypothetical protein
MMIMQSCFLESVKGTLNFAADRTDGGAFSNSNSAHIRQNLAPIEVELVKRLTGAKRAVPLYGGAVQRHSDPDMLACYD